MAKARCAAWFVQQDSDTTTHPNRFSSAVRVRAEVIKRRVLDACRSYRSCHRRGAATLVHDSGRMTPTRQAWSSTANDAHACLNATFCAWVLPSGSAFLRVVALEQTLEGLPASIDSIVMMFWIVIEFKATLGAEPQAIR